MKCIESCVDVFILQEMIKAIVITIIMIECECKKWLSQKRNEWFSKWCNGNDMYMPEFVHMKGEWERMASAQQ